MTKERAPKPTMSEGTLIKRYGQGDRRAAADVFDLFSGPILTIGVHLLGDRALAEEVVQTTLMKAFRSADTFDVSKNPRPWMYAIARRVTIDIYRRERRHVHDVETEVAALPPDFDRAWDGWQVRLAVDQLPPDEREVVRLAHLRELTHAEVAEELEIPIGTVKSRLHRAHKRLGGLLAHLEEQSA